MITWIQTSFGRHHKLLLGALLGITIISFVFFGAWSSASGSGRHGQVFLGVDLHSSRACEPYTDILQLAGGRADEQSLKSVILLTHLADAVQIPSPTETQFKKYIETSLGTNDAAKRQFHQQVQTILGVSPEVATSRIVRYFQTRWRIEQAQEYLKGPGYVLPFEAALLWRTQETQWTIAVATLDGTAFKPAIEVTEDALKAFFDEHKADFTIPPRVTADYALFSPSEADIAAVTTAPTDAELSKYAKENAQNFPGLDVKKIDEEIKTRRAELEKGWRVAQTRDYLAGRISSLLAEQLPFDEVAPNAEKIKQVLANAGAVVATAPSFDKNDVPKELPVPANILANALKLTSETWRSDVYPLTSNVVVFFHKQTEPAYIPTLEKVREKVVAAYTQHEKKRLFVLHSADIGKQLRGAVAEGKTFAETATALGLKVKDYPGFKISQEAFPIELLPVANSLVTELRVTDVGAVTAVLRDGIDARYAYIAKKDEPKLDANAPEIQDITKQIAAQSDAFRDGLMLNLLRANEPQVAASAP
ncbi:MAG: peptidyl-prolyl cis-trans isomerase [Puniceicoccales bacterium]|jgi:hypothetical protein|nr:peptidyl-prolyl cis-trans isomerase [Puniceicoccales bacterium]